MVLMALTTTLMATPMLALISPIYRRGMTQSLSADDTDTVPATPADNPVTTVTTSSS